MSPDCLHPAGQAATPPAGSFPHWADEPPVPPEGSLVPGSRFHEEQWVMAAGMLARGASFLAVSRSMGCSRTTLWRAYYGSQAFRHRVWWERQALNREADLRLASLRALVAEQVERLVSAGDPATVRWLADKLGLFALPDGRDASAASPMPSPVPPARDRDAIPAPIPGPIPETPAAAADIAAAVVAAAAAETAFLDDEDDIPGALRERNPPDPRVIAAILARPEAEGPKGVFPWTHNPDDLFPSLGSAGERRGGQGAFGRSGWR
ncbi:hypothetical protein [Azospirillum picis]|uniref:Homeodomain-like domain-containing protein n=1 Tax=Azospirillum picis TaxID=488438 RepID=A0ABU0MSG4_9PROT|nr:hypothetical protein [Azospirillum picis]MBP2302477.1 hypothetical protein [Azospirillum picis]MDQ0536056.1 hypothetical protein [Azospirillum picis]